VDPGVGTERLPIAIRVARGDVLVGPDNGLLMPAAEVLGGAVEARILENPELLRPQRASTFHGRDIFAPVAAHLAAGRRFEEVGRTAPVDTLVGLTFPSASIAPGRLETTVAWVDSFGNLRLFATPDDLSGAFGDQPFGSTITVERLTGSDGTAFSEPASWARTFGDQPVGALLVYGDSSGMLAISENQGSAARRTGVETGSRVRLHSARSRGGG
jgi:S-adenosylmethionine hydrolase